MSDIAEKDRADFLRGYLVCALWSSNDNSTPEGGEPVDDNYGVDDILPEHVEACRKDCEDFIDANAGDLKEYVEKIGDHPDLVAWARAGGDFWLTRNGHGAGFWDRGLGALGDRLSRAAKTYGEKYVTVDGDKVYTE